MSASHWDGVDRAPLRVGLAVIVATFSLLEIVTVHQQAADTAHFAGRGSLAPLVPATPAALAVVTAALLCALVVFARGRRPLLAGTTALLAMAPVSQWGVDYFGATSHNFMFPGGLLFGWLAGVAYARTLDPKPAGGTGRALAEELGEAGAMGVLAALYVGSATSKLLGSGLAWTDHTGVRFLVLSQRGVADFAWIAHYRALLIDSPTLARVAATGTLVVEGGAFFLLVGRRARTLWGLLIFLLHLNIIVIATMPYLEPMAFVLLFAVPWPALLRLRRLDPAPVDPGPRVSWPVLVALLLLAIASDFMRVGWRPDDPAQRDGREGLLTPGRSDVWTS